MQDLARYKQIQTRMQFAAELIASNIQNIAKIKGSALTIEDSTEAIRLANLTTFPGITQYSQNSNWTGGPLRYIPEYTMLWVKQLIKPKLSGVVVFI